MTSAVVFANGKLGVKKISDPILQKGHVMLKQTTFGINFADVDLIYGGSQNLNPEGIIGFEAVGIIEEVSQSCNRGFKVGQRVCYSTYHMPGAFVERRSVPEQFLIPIADGISDAVAATTLKGLVAQMLLFNVYRSKVGDAIAVASAASGIGSYLTQWAASLGINVLALVGSDAKKQIASSDGAYTVMNYKTDPKEIVKVARSMSSHKMGVNAVYDGVGAALFPLSIGLLAPLGIWVNYATPSGDVSKFQAHMLDSKSLFFARPSVYIHKAYFPELVISASEFHHAVLNGKVTPHITHCTLQTLSHTLAEIKTGKSIGQKVLTFK